MIGGACRNARLALGRASPGVRQSARCQRARISALISSAGVIFAMLLKSSINDGSSSGNLGGRMLLRRRDNSAPAHNQRRRSRASGVLGDYFAAALNRARRAYLCAYSSAESASPTSTLLTRWRDIAIFCAPSAYALSISPRRRRAHHRRGMSPARIAAPIIVAGGIAQNLYMLIIWHGAEI